MFRNSIKTISKPQNCLNILDLDNKNSEILISKKISSVLLFGYFQNFKIVKKIQKDVFNNIKIPTPKNKKIVELALKIKDVNSIAVGFRNYEETLNKSHYSSETSKIVPITYTNEIAHVCKKLDNPFVLLFSTKNFSFIKSIKIPCSFINIPKNFPQMDELEALWLLMRCRHHIFNNSTFYWWGAFLSCQTFGFNRNKRCISLTRNFINKNIYPPFWKKF